MPANCDAIVQIEDTKLVSEENGVEKEVEILIEPTQGLDIRCELVKCDVCSILGSFLIRNLEI